VVACKFNNGKHKKSMPEGGVVHSDPADRNKDVGTSSRAFGVCATFAQSFTFRTGLVSAPSSLAGKAVMLVATTPDTNSSTRYLRLTSALLDGEARQTYQLLG
jgi:hypothetical protein